MFVNNLLQKIGKGFICLRLILEVGSGTVKLNQASTPVTFHDNDLSHSISLVLLECDIVQTS
jgi:hypothetical protein